MAVTTTTAILALAAVSAASSISQGQAAAKQAGFQATVQRQQAQREREISVAEEEDFRRRQSSFLAQRRAALGASGIRQGTGTPLLTSEDFAREVEFQALRIRSGGEVRATRAEQQAGLTSAAGRSARQRGFFRAGSSLLSGASEAFG